MLLSTFCVEKWKILTFAAFKTEIFNNFYAFFAFE
ncbi:hypothetical protein Cpin_3364 [Chitinophaga pinensis DSM 2588]|uniref:Uncharacterized protein n=1 Tax=Chitinophaga pinensis (strain ATCC 43595 / DSM 2588 / LMG 13176 / NBRC 15968 / NCIMB 11800 / UQM 2034) TaxID=485918 RepID=A0A979GV57_CHIPD|nr:hypothetical protein Cpin_3364 [Chitinophaga pinensis DSM 2588]